MKSVLISIQPQWCELIANGSKTIEVRKTKPKLETPFKVYIYCTKSRKPYESFAVSGKPYECGGKVIGEFVCDKIFEIKYCCGSYCCKGLTIDENDRVAAASKLSLYDMRDYLSCNDGYGWNISDLVIYDTPKPLSNFIKCHYPWECCFCDYYDSLALSCNKPKRPPQSWCYVESESDTE